MEEGRGETVQQRRSKTQRQQTGSRLALRVPYPSRRGRLESPAATPPPNTPAGGTTSWRAACWPRGTPSTGPRDPCSGPPFSGRPCRKTGSTATRVMTSSATERPHAAEEYDRRSVPLEVLCTLDGTCLAPLAGVPVRGARPLRAGLLLLRPQPRVAQVVVAHLVAAAATLPLHARHAAALRALAAGGRARPPRRREPLGAAGGAAGGLRGAGAGVRGPLPGVALGGRRRADDGA